MKSPSQQDKNLCVKYDRLSSRKKSLIIDKRCGRGPVSRSLSFIAPTIGLDVDKNLLLIAKSAKHIHFICVDICHLPLKQNSVIIAVVASVFEFIGKLEDAIKQTKDI